jgi:RNA polymerase sigma-70 factor (ECF subfamily)
VKDLFLFRKPPEGKDIWLRSCLQKNESGLIRYVKSLVHNLEISKDIVQDSFLKLWQQDHVKLNGHETQWLFTTSRNRAYDYLRKKNRIKVTSEELVLSIPDTSLNSEEKLLNQSSEDMLEKLLQLLSPAQREVINLKFQHGLSYKEISSITGHSVNHVGVLIHNIVSSLKEKMKAADLKGGR